MEQILQDPHLTGTLVVLLAIGAIIFASAVIVIFKELPRVEVSTCVSVKITPKQSNEDTQ